MQETQMVYLPPRESFGKKLAMGLFCSAVVTVIYNFFYLKKLVIWLCAAILWCCGWTPVPPKWEKPPVAMETGIPSKPEVLSLTGKIEQKVKDAYGVFKDDAKSAGKHVEDKVINEPMAAAHAKVEQAKIAAELAKAKTEREKEEAKAKFEEEKRKAAEALEKRAEANRKRQEEEAERYREASEAWARKAPRGRCPFCGNGINVPKESHESRRCKRCGRISADSRIRAMGPPPMPNGFMGTRRRGIFG